MSVFGSMGVENLKCEWSDPLEVYDVGGHRPVLLAMHRTSVWNLVPEALSARNLVAEDVMKKLTE